MFLLQQTEHPGQVDREGALLWMLKVPQVQQMAKPPTAAGTPTNPSRQKKHGSKHTHEFVATSVVLL